MESSMMDSFFFPSSPLFTHQPSMLQTVEDEFYLGGGGHGGVSSASVQYGENGSDLLFPSLSAEPAAVVEKHLQLYQSQQEAPCDMEVPTYDNWQREERTVTPVVIDAMPASAYNLTSSSASSLAGSESGHSTPTFVATDSPMPMTHASVVDLPVVEVHRQSAPVTPTAQTMAPVVPLRASTSFASMQQAMVHGPSLLEQFSCTIPDDLRMEATAPVASQAQAQAQTSPVSRTIVKVKRERATTKRATTVTGKKAKESTQQQAQAVSPSVLPNLPIFTSQLSVPHQGNSGYTSDSSTHGHASSHPHSPAQSEASSVDSIDTARAKLVRKAELARLARKRKKTRLGDLEAEVARLEEELAVLKRTRTQVDRPAAVQDATTQMQAAVGNMIQAVQTGLADQVAATTVTPRANHASIELTGADAVSRANPTALTPLIDAFMAASNKSAAECAHHLAAVQKDHLKPMKTFEFLAWLMKQPHESHASVWSSLLSCELHVQPGSREYRELECFRQSMTSQHVFDGEVERAWAKLLVLFQKRATQQEKNMNRVRAILSEAQFCRLVAWINREQTSVPVQQTPVAAPVTMQYGSMFGRA